MGTVLRLIVAPLLVIVTPVALLLACVALMLSLFWGVICPRLARKTETESEIVDTFDEDFAPSIPLAPWMRRGAKRTLTQRYKAIRWAYGRQMFKPTSPQLQGWEARTRAAWAQMQAN